MAARSAAPVARAAAGTTTSNLMLPVTTTFCTPSTRTRSASSCVCAATRVMPRAALAMSLPRRCALPSERCDKRALASTTGTL